MKSPAISTKDIIKNINVTRCEVRVDKFLVEKLISPRLEPHMVISPSDLKHPSSPGQKIPSSPGQTLTSNLGQKLPSSPGQKLPSNLGQKLPSSPGQKLPSNLGQKL